MYMAALPDDGLPDDGLPELPEVTICIHKHGLYNGEMFEIPEDIDANILNAAPVNAVNMTNAESMGELKTIYDEYFESVERTKGLPLEDYVQIRGFELKQIQINVLKKMQKTRSKIWIAKYVFS